MSFKDRLERLHDSRRRQKERAQQGGSGATEDHDSERSVYYADDVDEEADTRPEDSQADGLRGESADAAPSRTTSGTDELDVSRETSTDVTADAPSQRPSTGETRQSSSTQQDADQTERGEVYETLERTYAMRDKPRQRSRAPDQGDSSSRSTTSDRSPRGHRASEGTNERRPSDGDIGNWVATLRRKAGDAIEQGDWEEAAPYLFEIVALVPNHPYGLEQLARYHRRRDETAAANRYRDRLERQSPFG